MAKLEGKLSDAHALCDQSSQKLAELEAQLQGAQATISEKEGEIDQKTMDMKLMTTKLEDAEKQYVDQVYV